MTKNDSADNTSEFDTAIVDVDVVESALRAVDGVSVSRQVPAASLCTYRVGGPLELVATIESIEALGEAAAALTEYPVPTLPVGRGSNLLVADSGFAGVIVLLGEGFADVTIEGTSVTAGAAASLPVVARMTAGAGLSGFTWAVGVPGSVGGAVRMNAGGHGSDMAASLTSVDIADLSFGGIVTVGVESLELGYRTSNLGSWQIVASATLELENGDAAEETAMLREIVAWRRTHQPGGANAGSVFTNPPDDSAGRLIDAAGMKGHRVGTAVVSEKHANFVQVDADGSANDVMQLMIEIVDRVLEHSGVRLHAETQLIGFDQELVDHVQNPSRAEGQ